ncbi:MAG: glycosyltransferase family 4 protein [Solirubrobacteraceae bacterium]|nr:glycosyltransferase family 4 protein [Solirubrobacteraceae bacterium]
MPRVLLNLLYLDPGRTGGMEVVARALLPELHAALPAGWELAALVNASAMASEGPWHDLELHALDVDVSDRRAWVFAELRDVPQIARRSGADLIHSLGNTGPWRSKVPRSVTVNDLIHHRVPHPGLALKSRGTGAFVAGGAKRARRVIVAAEQTRTDLVDIAGIDPGRIDVVPYGIAAPTVAPTPEDELRARLALGDRPLILSPSARQPHKNLHRLIEAHALLPAPRPLLVLPGYATGQDDALRRRTAELGLDDDVRWLGWIDQADLEGLYACSELLVFPSLYEGFGLPVLEAMLRGLPVACSDRGSLAEIAGDAALHFDPESPRAIADAMVQLHEAAPLRARLTDAGRAQAARYTWSSCAEGYLASFGRSLST